MKIALEDMGKEYITRIKDLRESLDVLMKNSQIDEFSTLTNQCLQAITNGGRIFFMGNGGSAAEATHLAAEFVSKCCIDHEPWPAMALNDSISAITAIGNDYGFEEIYSRQIKAFANSQSVVIGLSTSGKSSNVLRGLRTARSMGAFTSLWTSQLCPDTSMMLVDNKLVAPTISTPRAQELHLLWGHAMAEIIEISL
jgi:D-sedoheptulose 7-phosphate isomerase